MAKSSARRHIGNLNLFIFKFDLVLILMFNIYVLFAIPLYLTITGTFGSKDSLWLLTLFGTMFGFILLAWRNASNRSGILFAILPMVYQWWLVNVFFILGDLTDRVPLAGYIGWFLIGFTTLTFILEILALIGRSIIGFLARKGVKSTFKAIRTAAHQQRVFLAIGCAFIFICGGYMLISIQSIPQGSITVTPKDYSAHFAFWALTSHESYNTYELEQLNKYSVTLIGSYNRTEMEWWKQNYGNVTFSITVPGTYCDANAKQNTDLAEQYIDDVKTYNLTNIIGETFDWEGTGPTNASLHEQAVQIWSDFLSWKELNAPSGFNLTLLPNIWLYYAQKDNPHGVNMDQFTQSLGFENTSTERFDKYDPCIYRCSYQGAKPYGDPVTHNSAFGVRDTYSFYTDLKLSAQAIQGTFGNLDRLGVYLGETNCSCYGNATQVYENGQYMGTGFDSLIRDSLICKAFGIQTLTYFLLFPAPTPDGWIMGGNFGGYGDDFLEKLNDTVNGPNSTDPITITIGPLSLWKTGIPSFDSNLLMTFIYNLGIISYFAIWITVMAILGIIIAVITWKKRTDDLKVISKKNR